MTRSGVRHVVILRLGVTTHRGYNTKISFVEIRRFIKGVTIQIYPYMVRNVNTL